MAMCGKLLAAILPHSELHWIHLSWAGTRLSAQPCGCSSGCGWAWALALPHLLLVWADACVSSPVNVTKHSGGHCIESEKSQMSKLRKLISKLLHTFQIPRVAIREKIPPPNPQNSRNIYGWKKKRAKNFFSFETEWDWKAEGAGVL